MQDKLDKLEVVVLLDPTIEFCCNNWAVRKLFRWDPKKSGITTLPGAHQHGRLSRVLRQNCPYTMTIMQDWTALKLFRLDPKKSGITIVLGTSLRWKTDLSIEKLFFILKQMQKLDSSYALQMRPKEKQNHHTSKFSPTWKTEQSILKDFLQYLIWQMQRLGISYVTSCNSARHLNKIEGWPEYWR